MSVFNPDTGSLSGFVSYSSGRISNLRIFIRSLHLRLRCHQHLHLHLTEPEPDKTTQPIKTDPKQETTVSTQLPTEKISLTSKTSDAPTPRTGEIGSQMIIGLSLLLVAGVLILISAQVIPDGKAVETKLALDLAGERLEPLDWPARSGSQHLPSPRKTNSIRTMFFLGMADLSNGWGLGRRHICRSRPRTGLESRDLSASRRDEQPQARWQVQALLRLGPRG